MNHIRHSIACLLAAFVATATMADGGAPIASVTAGEHTWTLLVRPASPTVGPIEFTLLGPASPSATLRLLAAQEPAPEVLGLEPQDGVIGRVARTSIGTAGDCTFEVTLEGHGGALLKGTIPVTPRAPGWRERWPWLLAWVPVAALLALRARAVRGHRVT
jgi:hypothetical protein